MSDRANISRAPEKAPAKRPPAAFMLKRKVTYKSIWVQRNTPRFDRSQMNDSLLLACRWMSERSMNAGEIIADDANPCGYRYRSWRGAAREYDAGKRKWYVFGPLWHTGQMAKALVMAHKLTGQAWLLDAARRAGEFLLQARIDDPSIRQHGLIVATENSEPNISATSCMLESLDGLIHLARAVPDDPRYWQAVVDALDWAERNVYLPDEGLFLDNWHLEKQAAFSAPNTQLHGVPGRPLIDDGVFLKAYLHCKRPAFRAIFYSLADRLLAEESPSGNWIAFPPCDQVAGAIHPRQAYWWGAPMVQAWLHSEDERYLECAHRVAEWYVKAQRCDGGMFRLTNGQFNTTSFGQATSGSLAAACLWRDLIAAGKGDAYREPLRRSIQFGLSMQFTRPSDPNLLGAILEKTEPPNGGDELPYTVRDLASIFYVQALAGAMQDDLLF